MIIIVIICGLSILLVSGLVYLMARKSSIIIVKIQTITRKIVQ